MLQDQRGFILHISLPITMVSIYITKLRYSLTGNWDVQADLTNESVRLSCLLYVLRVATIVFPPMIFHKWSIIITRTVSYKSSFYSRTRGDDF
jgi:hypothetical protein